MSWINLYQSIADDVLNRLAQIDPVQMRVAGTRFTSGVPSSRRRCYSDDLRDGGQKETTICCVKCDIRTIYDVT